MEQEKVNIIINLHKEKEDLEEALESIAKNKGLFFCSYDPSTHSYFPIGKGKAYRFLNQKGQEAVEAMKKRIMDIEIKINNF